MKYNRVQRQQRGNTGLSGPQRSREKHHPENYHCLLKNYNGIVRVMGKQVREWGEDYYEKIGVSFELPNLYQKLTGRENLDLIRSFYSGKTVDPLRLLKMVELEDIFIQTTGRRHPELYNNYPAEDRRVPDFKGNHLNFPGNADRSSYQRHVAAIRV